MNIEGADVPNLPMLVIGADGIKNTEPMEWQAGSRKTIDSPETAIKESYF